MINYKELKILSRKSDLAQIQAKLVGSAILQNNSNVKITYLTKSTEGDLDQKSPLSSMKIPGVFTDDLRKSLIDNKCDIVVHSWKDLPIDIGTKTNISGTLKRADERDILLIPKKRFGDIKKSKKISILSSSPRRVYNLKSFIKDYFPFDCNVINFINVRGNIPTRLDKLIKGEGDALIVAKAAIDRLINNPFKEYQILSTETEKKIAACNWMVIPLSINPCSPGQGALAIETHTENKSLNKIIKEISDPLTYACVEIERKVLKKFGGGCHQKIGVSCFPTFFGLIKVEKGKLDDNGEFYDLSIIKNAYESNSKVNKSEIYPENLLDYDFYDREVINESVGKINLLKNHCIWISRKSALPIDASISCDNIIWTSGLKTWKALAKRGIWVNGTSDNMGEDFNPNIQSLCKYPWVKLTHDKSPKSIIEKVIFTYKLKEKEFFPNIIGKNYFFWMSSTAFILAISKEPSILNANHACGPGNTFKEIKKMIKDPSKLSIHLSYDKWRKSITNE